MEDPGLAALKRAVEIAGGQAALAKRLQEIADRLSLPLKCTPGHIWAWLNRDKKVPGEWARHVAEAVDFQVLPMDVRGDLYPNRDDGVPPAMRGREGRAAA